ncbi:zinc metallopeptidase [Acetivibrio sp. MSJd-27]|uniref:zinc metallopeptidase n=1 Tax=Acetivibrio sp. MSJd-27 TaxID=2841523 RepID=UPI001C1066CC|nr:zinc metallopeptidase [Acetivibrio sp. MSJd-27]MBU5449507.1 zinc metallopeptidase [Acetivibrio sp. MSJd-27]
MPYFYPTDIYYLILVVPALLVALFADIKVKSAFSKYSKIPAKAGYTAREVARFILDSNGLQDVQIERIGGNLTDHYDPRSNTVRLSDNVYASTSVATLGIAAHEVGHAIQHSKNYTPIKVRNALVPVTQIASYAAIPLALIGLIFGNILLKVGIILFAVTVLFQLVTLPVEFNASSRAMETLKSNGFMENDDLAGTKKVLSAAAFTYVAAALVALMNLLRLILLARDRRD